MAEPGKEPAAAPPPLPQEAVFQALAAVEGPSLETDTPISASQDIGTAVGGAATLDSAQPKAESAHRAPPQETVAVAAVGAPEQTTTEADGQPSVATMSEKVAALPSPAETPAQESATPEQTTTEADGQPPVATMPEEVAALPPPADTPAQESAQPEQTMTEADGQPPVATMPEEVAALPPLAETPAQDGAPPEQTTMEADGQPPVATMPQKVAALPAPAETPAQESAAPAAPTPPPPPPPQKQEGGEPKLAPSAHEEDKDAPKAREEEGEEKPARRRWRCLRAAVCLLFLRPKSREAEPPTPPGDKQPVSGLEEKKPTPGEMPPPQKDSGSAVRVPSKPEAGKGEAEMKPSARDGKKAASGQEEQKPGAKKKPSRKYSEKDDGERSKGRRDETQAGKATPQVEGERRMLKKLQKAIRLVQRLMSLYNRHRSQDQEKQPETASGPGGEEHSVAKAEENQPQTAPRNWPREEVRLERILEEAFTRLLATEYTKELRGVRQKCLLTFSVFDLDSVVKKQVMIYWWVAEFNLQHRSDPPQAPAARAPAAAGGGGGRSDSPAAAPQGKGAADADGRDDAAENIFFMLSDHGFLVPTKNWCSMVIHACRVNPLVHWMLKRQARGDRFAVLDDKGSPADSQPDSSILCLTAGNRPVLQKMRVKDDESQPQTQTQTQARKKVESRRPQSQAGRKSKKATKEPSLQGKSNNVQDQQQPTTKDEAQVGSKSMGPKNMPPERPDDEVPKFEGKRVILNVDAHVYPISKYAFLNLAECLVVLQLGRWNDLDDKTYMEVEGLESRNAIGLLKNLRYLGLRGLSRLTVLPNGIESLKKLVILDMRGCQNLVKVAARVITQLKQLTHLDLTECYMLEHIGRGVTSLTELQVFKGFVFATGTQGKTACRIQDLKRLKKLQKLSISITTDANVGKGEMAELKHLTSLRKLTITWSEIPSILEADNNEKVKARRRELVERWTSFQLPKDLIKLDIRCYPKKELQLECHEKLEKLYLRGGDMKRFSTKKASSIKTLRLRYLKHFEMGWDDIRSELEKVEYVEIVVNIENAPREKDKSEVTEDIEIIEPVMKIPEFTLDGHGVWTKDQKEEDNRKKEEDNRKLPAPNKDAMGKNRASRPSDEPTEDSSTKAPSNITNVNKDDVKAATKEQTKKNE